MNRTKLNFCRLNYPNAFLYKWDPCIQGFLLKRSDLEKRLSDDSNKMEVTSDVG